MERKKQRMKYMVADLIASAIAWTLFYFYRRYFIDSHVSDYLQLPFTELKFYLELVLMPIFWLFIFYISGYYDRLFHKSRISELFLTFSSVGVGACILFFILIINDNVVTYKFYYLILIMLFVIEFTLVYINRIRITYRYLDDLESGNKGFKTIIVGDVPEGVVEAAGIPRHLGNRFIGVVMRDRRVKGQIVNGYKCYGSYDELDNIIQTQHIEEVVLGLKNADVKEIQTILNVLYRRNVHIKVIPDTYEKIIGSAKLIPIYGCPLMEISHEIMSPFQMRIKRLMDVGIASVVLFLLSPLYLFIMVRIMFDSKGSPIYKQERIGKNGKPFTMYKFRSMVVSAEKERPLLAQPDDDRITNYGRYMRKYRIDELPQFWNVLKGDMAIVGPRPERQFFIDRMVTSEPDYFFLQKIRPGITSLGMVKFGYADNVEKMLKRFKYDLIYVENMSLMLDFKVLYYTFFVILTGKGV